MVTTVTQIEEIGSVVSLEVDTVEVMEIAAMADSRGAEVKGGSEISSTSITDYGSFSRTHQGNLSGAHFGCFGVSGAI